MNHKILRIMAAFALLAGCLAQTTRAQQEPPSTQNPPPTQNPPNTDNPPKQDVPANPPQAPLPPGVADPSTGSPPIRTMNGAGPLPSGRVSQVQFGPIYLQSAEFLQLFDAITATGQTGTVWDYSSLFRAQIVFDHAFKNSHVAVQYQPRLMVINGNVNVDTGNLNAEWSTSFHLTPRLNASLTNSLSYFSRQGQFDNLDLMADVTTGSLVQSNFLEGSGQFLTDRTEFAVVYQTSPRGRFGVTPYFEYQESTGTQAIGQSLGYGASATYAYLLTPTSSASVQYQVDDTHFSKFLPVTVYQTVSGTYAQQLTPTWRFAIGGGVSTSSSTASSSTTTPSTRSTQVTENALFSLIKTFGHATLAFNYYRGQALGLQITNGFADRFDLSYVHRLSRRTEFDLGAGYYREFLSATNTSGFYASAGTSYWLADKVAVTSQYSYKKQENGGLNYKTGKLQYISVGIRWEPGRRPGDY
jgi:hypothetical protein